MDEVKAMTQAGESVGKAVGTGLRTIRRNAVRAGQAGAEQAAKAAVAAEHKFAEQTSTLVDNVEAAREELVKSSRRARRKLAKNAKKTANKAAKRASTKLDGHTKKAKKAGRKANKQAAAASAEFSRKVQKKLSKLEGRTAKLRSKAERNPGGRSRRWVWLLGAGGVAAIAVVVVKSRQSAPEPTAPVIPLGGDASTNGVAPKDATPVSEHKN
jgi:hypothetical protein